MRTIRGVVINGLQIRQRTEPNLSGQHGPPFEHIWLESTPYYDVSELTAGDRVEAALDHYRGDFLADVDVDGSVLFDDWVSGRRQELRTGVIRTLTLAGEESADAGEWSRCRRCAERADELEPWNENAHRQVMMPLAATSGASAALAHYATCEAIMSAELGLPPSPDTVALRDEIAAGRHTARSCRRAPVRSCLGRRADR